jgi:hypothetical protein
LKTQNRFLICEHIAVHGKVTAAWIEQKLLQWVLENGQIAFSRSR